jgi:hypothetical protein
MTEIIDEFAEVYRKQLEDVARKNEQVTQSQIDVSAAFDFFRSHD